MPFLAAIPAWAYVAGGAATLGGFGGFIAGDGLSGASRVVKWGAIAAIAYGGYRLAKG